MYTSIKCAVAIAFGMVMSGCSSMNGSYSSGYSTTPRVYQLEMPYPTSPSAAQTGTQDKVEGGQAPAVPGPTK
jgi:hypothetical protein